VRPSTKPVGRCMQLSHSCKHKPLNDTKSAAADDEDDEEEEEEEEVEVVVGLLYRDAQYCMSPKELSLKHWLHSCQVCLGDNLGNCCHVVEVELELEEEDELWKRS
jgi:hypothetical protein